ncbi:MAG: AlkA N-terminal domain-containing protein, partial [Thermoleophilaceae bacterium]
MIEVRLECRPPFDGGAVLRFLAARAVAGLEEVAGPGYRRSLRLEHGAALAELAPEARAVRCSLWLDDERDLAAAAERCRHTFDLDADPAAIGARLGEDPVLRALVGARPGLRVPGCVDGFELAVRAVLGQQVTLAAARHLSARLVRRYGSPAGRHGETWRLFPTPGALAGA